MRPNIKYDNLKTNSIICPSRIIVQSFFIIYGVCSLIALPVIIEQLTSNIQIFLNDSNAGDILYQINMNNVMNGNGIMGLLSYAALIRNFFRECFIFFLFYYLTLERRSRSLTIYLITILTLDILSALISGGRTSFTMMVFAIGSAYFIFNDYWNPTLKKIINSLILGSGIFFLLILVILTYSRFSSNNYSESPLWSILSYLGQSPLNFDQYGLDAGGIRYGDRTMNGFKSLLGLNPPENIYAVRHLYSAMKMNDSYFYTFVGDFTLDFGPIGAFIIFCVFSYFTTKLIKSKRNSIKMYELLIVYFCSCVCSQGSMYLFYYSFVQNYTIVAFVIVYFILYIDGKLKNKKHQVITKYNARNKNISIKWFVHNS